MDTGRVVRGVILLVVAMWALLTPGPTFKYAGGAILGILGVALIVTGIKER